MLRAKTTRRKSDAKDRVLDEVMREETTRLNAVVPLSLHRKIKIQAANEGRSITELVIAVLNEYLSKHSKLQ